MMIFLTVLLGLIVGLLSTFLGLGGGLLFVTFLPQIYIDIDQKTAIGTALASVFFIVSINTLRFHRRGLVHWKTVFILTPSAWISAFLAGKIASFFPNEILILFLASILGFLSFWSFTSQKAHQKKKPRKAPPSFWKITALGTYSGGMSGLTGIGSGAVTSTCFLNWNMVPNQKVSPTSNAVMIMTTLSGLLAYIDFQTIALQMGYVRWDIAFVLFAASFLTASFGVRMQSRITESNRRLALAILLLVFCFYECYLFYLNF